MKKTIIYEWLFKLALNNNLTDKEAKGFAQNYIDDKIGLNMIKKQYIDKNLKKNFENICIKSFKLQKKIKYKKDLKFKNYKNKYCCKNIYHGNKKYCDLCNRLLKF